MFDWCDGIWENVLIVMMEGREMFSGMWREVFDPIVWEWETDDDISPVRLDLTLKSNHLDLTDDELMVLSHNGDHRHHFYVYYIYINVSLPHRLFEINFVERHFLNSVTFRKVKQIKCSIRNPIDQSFCYCSYSRMMH